MRRLFGPFLKNASRLTDIPSHRTGMDSTRTGTAIDLETSLLPIGRGAHGVQAIPKSNAFASPSVVLAGSDCTASRLRLT